MKTRGLERAYFSLRLRLDCIVHHLQAARIFESLAYFLLVSLVVLVIPMFVLEGAAAKETKGTWP